jgi:hypothetical protein
MLSCICIQQYAAMHCLLLQSRSQHFSCFFATNRMNYSANHTVIWGISVGQISVGEESFEEPRELPSGSWAALERTVPYWYPTEYLFPIAARDRCSGCLAYIQGPAHEPDGSSPGSSKDLSISWLQLISFVGCLSTN